MLKITQNKGFQMTFENGWTVSVQFGYGNYCENNYHPGGYNFASCKELIKSKDAEIAAWDNEGKWYNFETDTVRGYVSADEAAEFINMIKNK